MRFPTDTTPPNQRWLAENDALVEQNIWMMYPPGDREITDFTHLNMVILFIEEEVEEEESGFRKGRLKDPMEDLVEDKVEIIM